jgi:dihydrofolate reductase
VGKIVYYDMSMSLDGFIAGTGVSPEAGLGVGGERLHEWVFSDPDPQSLALLDQSSKRLGAMITGRRTYDLSVRWWGSDGPTGEARVPLFVLTHRASPGPDPASVYTFVTGGVDALVERARAAAGEKDIGVSGVEIGRQLLQAGHIDEILIHVVPVLFGDGVRLYEQVGGEHIGLEIVETIPTANVTHLRYRVLKPGR